VVTGIIKQLISKNKYILIQTSRDVESFRRELFSNLTEEQQKLIIIYYGNRTSKEDIEKLIDKFELDVIKWDEWLSTVSAHRDMNDMNIKKKKKRGIVDTIASVHILQNYLDAQRNKINIF
jgi:RNase H-fold protein (predicted Holliday junction resolvase)